MSSVMKHYESEVGNQREKKQRTDYFGLRIIVVVPTGKTYFVEKLVARALDTRVRVRVRVRVRAEGVVGGDKAWWGGVR
jgi:hypothetical protein